MYGLKEAGILAFNYIVTNLAPFGYHPIKHTLGLWKHATRPTTFTLHVGDFRIKSYSEDDKEYLLNALCKNMKSPSIPKVNIILGQTSTGTTSVNI